jgi:hypothetical protein
VEEEGAEGGGGKEDVGEGGLRSSIVWMRGLRGRLWLGLRGI